VEGRHRRLQGAPQGHTRGAGEKAGAQVEGLPGVGGVGGWAGCQRQQLEAFLPECLWGGGLGGWVGGWVGGAASSVNQVLGGGWVLCASAMQRMPRRPRAAQRLELHERCIGACVGGACGVCVCVCVRAHVRGVWGRWPFLPGAAAAGAAAHSRTAGLSPTGGGGGSSLCQRTCQPGVPLAGPRQEVWSLPAGMRWPLNIGRQLCGLPCRLLFVAVSCSPGCLSCS
jgi:hypothetical protein